MPPAEHDFISDLFNAAVILGWCVLILTGLEADRPMSGGIPGHVDPTSGAPSEPVETRLDRLGTAGGWILFLGVTCLLPVVLIWILGEYHALAP